MGISMVPFKMMVYVENRAEYMPADEVSEDDKVLNISGTEFRRRLRDGLDIPDWFSYPKVVAELRRAHPPKHKQGFTIDLMIDATRQALVHGPVKAASEAA